MTTTIEFPLVRKEPICKTTGELVVMYPTITFLKYTYLDPKDAQLKAVDPNITKDAPIVPPRIIPEKFIHIHEDGYGEYYEDGSPVMMPFIQHAYITISSENYEDLLKFMEDDLKLSFYGKTKSMPN